MGLALVISCGMIIPQKELVDELKVRPRSFQGGFVLFWIELGAIGIARRRKGAEEVGGKLPKQSTKTVTR